MNRKGIKPKKKSARELALITLYKVEQEEAYSNIALNAVLEEYQPEKIDRAFTTELVYGTLRSLMTLDWTISQFLKKPLKSLTPWIRNILRLSLYQITFMDKVPVSAAVNEGTELAKRYGHQGTVRFVNGVLRNISRNLDNLSYPSLQAEPVKHIAVKYSHPEWLVEKWLGEFGLEETIKLCQANNENPPNVVRTNTLKITREALIEKLQDEGVESEKTSYAPEGLIIKNSSSFGSLNAFRQGYLQPQDESSMLVATVVNPQKEELVIDACSAPGGKTTHLAQIMGNTGKIIAADIYQHKMGLVKENARRLGITNIELVQVDARNLSQKYANQAHKVLVDAPCSGLGVLRRKPDSRWRKDPQQIIELQVLQQEILQQAAKCVASGGVLVYSTCSIAPEENINNVKRFLELNQEFALSDLTDLLPGALLDFKDLHPEQGFIQLLPHVHGMDGFFIARFEKKAGF